MQTAQRLVQVIAVLFAFAGAVTAAQAQTSGQWKSGEHIYSQTCAFCHSAAVGPNLLGRNLPPEYVTHVVTHGLRAMPAFRPTDFSQEDVHMLATWIRDSKAPAAVTQAGGQP